MKLSMTHRQRLYECIHEAVTHGVWAVVVP